MQVDRCVIIIKDKLALDLVEVSVHSQLVQVVQHVTTQKKAKYLARYLIKRLRFRCHGLFNISFFNSARKNDSLH